MATNLDIQAQLNQLLAEQNKFFEQTAKLAKDQATFTKEMVDTLRSANFKDVTSDIQNASQAVSGASDATKNLGTTNQDVFEKLNNSLKEAVKEEEKVNKGIVGISKSMKMLAATAALDGLLQGLRFTKNMLITAKDAGVGLVETMGNLAASIIAIPFKMLSGLINMADSGGGDTALRQALEDIREEFGALHATSGQAIISMARSMKGELAQTGLSVYRIFGNLAERLKTMQEYAHNLGPLFAALAGQFVKNAEAIGAYYKGLGLTEEGQKAVATRAYALQTALTEELREIANYSLQLSKAFNGAAGSAKEISRDMATLMADFKHFGGISTKEIGQAVVYFRRLGIEISKVMGVIDKYDNFEDAATGAAHLSQAFNLNVDALEMMKAQNPAQRVEMLRKSFFAAGRSVENMTRQERALLAQQTGLEDSALDLAFSMKNQGMTYDQVTRKADAAKKTQMTQVEAMKALADSIERLVKSGSFGKGGFIDRFIQGFTAGIQRSRDFRHLMRELRVDLRVAYYEGIKVGRAFVDMFPGVKDVFKGLSDLFDRRRFREMFRGATEAFREFFRNMTVDPQTAMPKLLENLKRNFFSWFQGNSQNGQRILNGFKTFFAALSEIAGSLLKISIRQLTEGIKFITDLVSGRKTLDLSGGSNSLGFFGRLLKPIVDSIKETGPELWVAIKGMFNEVWTKAQPWLEENLLKIAGVLAAPAMVGMIAKPIAATLGAMFIQGILEFVKGQGMKSAVSAVRDRFGDQVQNILKASENTPRIPSGGGQAGQGAASVIRGAEEAASAAAGSKVNWGAALLKMAAITAFITVGMVGVLFGIYRFAKAIQEDKITPQSIATASLAMITTAGALVGIAGAVKMLSTIDLATGSAKSILAGLVVVGLVGTGMVVAAKKMIETFGEVPMAKITKTALVLTAISGFFLAASATAGVAAAIGIATVATGGLGVAAIIAGLATLALVTEGMSVQGIRIMDAVDKFRPGPNFAEKARTFVEIMKGIGAFTSSVAQLVAASRPGILDFLRGAGSQQQRETMKSVQATVRVLSGEIKGIIDNVKSAMTSLSGGEQQLKAAESLGSILGGVSQLAAALKPPTEALQESGITTSLFGTAETVGSKLEGVRQFIGIVGPTLKGLMLQIVEVMMTGPFSSGLSTEQARAGLVFVRILGSVSEFMNSLRAGTSAILQVASKGNQASVLTAVGNYMTALLKGIGQSNLFDKVKDLMSSLTSSLTNINPEQARAIQTFAPIIAPVFQTISQIATTVANLTSGNRPPGASSETIAQLTDFVSTFFRRIETSLPNLLNSMKTSFAGLNRGDVGVLSQGIGALKSLFDVIATIPNTSKALTEAGGPQIIESSFAVASETIARMAVEINPSNEMGIGNWLRHLDVGVTALTGEIQKGAISRLSHVVTGMVAEVNQLATTIRGIQPINIETSLRRLGDSLGLGADGQYRIENRNFTINVNVTVKFDNNSLDAFELGLIRRTGPHPTRLSYNDSNG